MLLVLWKMGWFLLKISIAGAGAGKTTKIAELIIQCFESCDNDKIVYCIAYTNNAAECIKRKIESEYGSVPEQIHISTIHSFLYQEIIQPYYHLLFNRHFDKISVKDLTKIDSRYKSAELRRLEEKGYLHVEAISERAKWVFVKKSTDNKEVKDKRALIQKIFCDYCGGIFLDEAQDINDDIYAILSMFFDLGINVSIMGDPKQDLRGFGNLRKIAEKYMDSVSYISECYRCPESHIILSNTIVEPAEQQTSLSSKTGELTYCYENDINVAESIEQYDLAYISAKNARFETHSQTTETVNETVFLELLNIFTTCFPDDDEKKLQRASYYFAEKMEKDLRMGKDIKAIINDFLKALDVTLDRTAYAKLATAVNGIGSTEQVMGVEVSSIESIKGMEGKNCLFILTTDLADYLFQKKKDDNKIKHKLYVALTRSLDKLTIMVSSECEKKYGRKEIDTFFAKYINRSTC